MDQIEHVVVLMLENRSFDSMLGWLYEHDLPSHNIPPLKPGQPAYRGLQAVKLDRFTNTALDGKLKVAPRRGAQGFTVPTVDPGEEFRHVNEQFFGEGLFDITPGKNGQMLDISPKAGLPVTMKGVLSDFVKVLAERKYTDEDIARLAPQVMETFTPAQLPVLSQLARHYAVSDEWFASVPSQTNPNRAFLLCGTSNGMVDNGYLEPADSPARAIETVLGMGIGDDRVDARTIFNELDAAGKDWAVFWQTSYLPQKLSTTIDTLEGLIAFLHTCPGPGRAAAIIADAALALSRIWGLGPEALAYLRQLSAGDLASSYTWRLFPQIQKIPGASKNFHSLDDFHTRARNGTLPAFSYIEPFWSIARTTTDNRVYERLMSALGNDYHPPSNLLVGEEFVKSVYTSLISNTSAWQKTLLMITFDEFVGTFDHVTNHLAAGKVAPPWGATGQPPECQYGFNFDRLGGRVPTILVSPYIQKGTVFRSNKRVPYDHTSLIATTLKWIGKGASKKKFGSRTTNAPTFERVLKRSRPRTDAAALPFLDTERLIGDPLRYGESFSLQNQSGDYLTSAYPTLKFGGGGSLLPQGGIDLLADIGLAAYFPRYGSVGTATVTLVSHSPDPNPQVTDGDTVRIVSREAQLGSRNVLGAWPDSSDCYYYDEYVDGDNAGLQAWTIKKLDLSKGKGVCYGDSVYLASASEEYAGQRLTRDVRPLNTDNWITTASSGGDSWRIVPAQARAGLGLRIWEEAPPTSKLCASAQGGPRGLQLWAVDTKGIIWSTYQADPSATWSPWARGWGHGGPVTTAYRLTAALHNHTEVVEIWASGFHLLTPQALLSCYQTDPGGNWTDWTVWDKAPAMIPANAIAACREGGDRSVRLWCVDAKSKLRCNYLDGPKGQWTGWSQPGWNGAPDNVQDVCAILQSDGTIRAWLNDATGNVYTAAQSSPGGDNWTPWSGIGAFSSDVAALAACQIDQGAQLWVLDRAGVLHSTYQTTPAGTWSPWDPPGYQGKAPGWHRTGLLKAVTAARQPGGETAIWVVDTASKLHHAAHKAGAWRDWSPPFKS